MDVLKAASVAPRRLSGLSSKQGIAAALQRERARADRMAGQFAIVVLGPVGRGRRGMIRLARAVARRARETDEVGWYDGEQVCTILPDCSAEGAHRFARDVAESIGMPLSDRICKIFSYPARRNGAATAVSPRHANGHANGDANGHTNGNTNGHLNGHANGENGHVPALTDATGMVLKAGDTNVDRRHSGSGQDLVPFVIEGFKQELASTSLPVGQIEPFIAHPLPLWKRALDISCSLTALVVFAPVMVTVAMAIRMTMGTPVLFKQRRTGLGGKPFLLYKFRTMVPDAEAKKAALRRFSEQDGPAFKMKVDPRVTPLGSFLRRTSLDELPQLWNVVRGDMSMVGPRPLPCDESDACEPWQLRRLDVTPGITCIWQVKGRSTVTFTEWVRMDMAYIRRRKFMNDLAILFQTIPAVLKRRGAR